MLKYSIHFWIELIKREVHEMHANRVTVQKAIWENFHIPEPHINVHPGYPDEWEKDRWLDWKKITFEFYLKKKFNLFRWIKSLFPSFFGRTKTRYKLTKPSTRKAVAVYVEFSHEGEQLTSQVKLNNEEVSYEHLANC